MFLPFLLGRGLRATGGAGVSRETLGLRVSTSPRGPQPPSWAVAFAGSRTEPGEATLRPRAA